MKKLLFFLFIIHSVCFSQVDKKYYYKVKKGDSLSVIVYSIGLAPARKFIPILQKLNPGLINTEIIQPNTHIYLPTPDEKFQKNFTVLPTKEVLINKKIITQTQKDEFVKALAEYKSDQQETTQPAKEVEKEKSIPLNSYFGFSLSNSLKTITYEVEADSSTNEIPYNVLQGLFFYELANENVSHKFEFNLRSFKLPSLAEGSYSNDTFTNLKARYILQKSLFSKNFNIDMSIGYEEKEALLLVSEGNIVIEKLNSPVAGLRFSYLIPNIIDITPYIQGNYYTETKVDDYEVENIFSQQFGLDLNYKLKRSLNLSGIIEAEMTTVKARHAKLDVDTIESDEVNYLFGLTLSKEF